METFETPQPDRPLDDGRDWTKIILAAVVGLGLLVGSAYAGYYYGTQQVQQPEKPTSTPTTPGVEDETAGWETYTNSNHAFEFKYPDDWTLTTGKSSGLLLDIELAKEDPTQEKVDLGGGTLTAPRYAIRISVLDNPSNLSARKYLSKWFDEEQLETVGVAGTSGVKHPVLGAPATGTGVTISYATKIYQISYATTAHSGTRNKFLGVFDQILSTLKLLDVEDETKDWKTYTDATYKFSLKYPSSWQIAKGNEHAPSIPSNMTEIINLQSKVNVVDVSIIPWHNNLKKDLREELSSFISRYLGDVSVSYENDQIGGETALRGSYLQSALGSQTKVILTVVEKGDYVLFFQTQFDTEDSSRLDLYNQILSTFKFLD